MKSPPFSPSSTQVNVRNESLESRHITAGNLPKIELKKFDGNILNWNSFWQSFASAVHGRDDLSDVDKYNYLKSLLTDKAQEVISGLSLTAANYYEAIELLC